MKKVLLLLFILPFVFSSCSSDDDDNSIKVEQREFVMNFEDTQQINATSKASITYKSESEYVAKVSTSGLITAGRVGETSILLSNGEDSKSISVKVEPLHNIYPEPIHKIKFGDSKATVKSAFGNNAFEQTTSLLYNDYHKNYDYAFLFEDGKLTATGVVIPTLSLPDNFSDFFTERYQIVALEDYQASFINEKEDMAVGISPTDDLDSMLVIYIPFSATRSSSSTSIKDDLIKAYKEFNK